MFANGSKTFPNLSRTLFFLLLNQHIELPPVYICVVMTINFFRIIRISIDDRCFRIEAKFVIAEKVFCEHAGEVLYRNFLFILFLIAQFQMPFFNYFNYYLPLKIKVIILKISLSFFLYFCLR